MIQSKSNIALAIKRQSGLGVPASGAGATGYDMLAGQRLNLTVDDIPNNVIRRDGQSALNRHGLRSSGVPYKFPMRVGALDALLEASVRGTFNATFNITQATTLGGSAAATSVTTTTSTIVAAAGDWRLQGIKRGMKIKCATFTDAGNNGKWFRVVGVTALAITVGGTPLIANAVANTTFSVTVAKYLANPSALIERYHTIDEYDQDVQYSTLGTDCKISKIEFNAQPNGLIEVTFTFMGLDAIPQAISPTSPILTNPTYSTSIPLVLGDGLIRVNGIDLSIVSGFQFTWDMGGEAPKVIAPTSPDIVLGNGKFSGQFQVLRQDLSYLTAFRNETIGDILISCVEPGGVNPVPFTDFYFGKVTFAGNTVDVAQTGPATETIPIKAGIDDQGTDHLLTTMLISSSAP